MNGIWGMESIQMDTDVQITLQSPPKNSDPIQIFHKNAPDTPDSIPPFLPPNTPTEVRFFELSL